jgi:hypothetical protein
MYEDRFESDPKALLEASRGEDGEIVIEETGDDLIDKWEKELAQGLQPDLTEGLSKQELEKLEKERAKSKGARQKASLIGTTNENFDPMYQSKFAGRGTREEEKLLEGKLLGHGKPIPPTQGTARRR